MQKRISQTFVWNGLKVLVVVFLGFVGVLRADVQDDAQEIVEYFYTLNAEEANPHKKINHAKGFCAIGEFIPNKEVAKDFAIPLLHNNHKKIYNLRWLQSLDKNTTLDKEPKN